MKTIKISKNEIKKYEIKEEKPHYRKAG